MSSGFRTLPSNNNVAKSSYIDCLPVLAECLSEADFENELDGILDSIVLMKILWQKFLDVFPKILCVFEQQRKFKLIYFIGSRVISGGSTAVKLGFLELAEKLLAEYNDIDYEMAELITPFIEPGRKSSFLVWRLSRLTDIVPDNNEVHSIVFKLFNSQENLQNYAEFLSFVSKKEAIKYVLNAFLNPVASVKAAAVDAIGYHRFDNSEELIDSYVVPETNILVLEHALKLPIDMITIKLLKKLIYHPDLGKRSMNLALKSKYIADLIPDLIKNGCAGCELNELSFDIISKINPLPFDFISLIFKESQEILMDHVIEFISHMDEENVLFRIVFPRMGEKGSWRTRYAAIKIFKEIITRKDEAEMLPDHAGFIIAMALDHCYKVRQAVMECLCAFPDGWVRNFAIDSILSLGTPSADPFHRSVLYLMITEAAPVLVNCGTQVMEVRKLLGME